MTDNPSTRWTSTLLPHVLAIILFLGLYGAWVDLQFDVGREFLLIQRISQGASLYVANINFYGPAPYWLAGTWIASIGLPVIHGVQLLNLLLFLITLAAMQGTLRHWLSSWASTFTVLPYVALAAIGSCACSFFMPHSEAIPVGITIGALSTCAMSRSIQTGNRLWLWLSIPGWVLFALCKHEFLAATLAIAAALVIGSWLFQQWEWLLAAILTATGLALAVAGLVWWYGADVLARNYWPNDAVRQFGLDNPLWCLLRAYSPRSIWSMIRPFLFFVPIGIIAAIIGAGSRLGSRINVSNALLVIAGSTLAAFFQESVLNVRSLIPVAWGTLLWVAIQSRDGNQGLLGQQTAILAIVTIGQYIRQNHSVPYYHFASLPLLGILLFRVLPSWLSARVSWSQERTRTVGFILMGTITLGGFGSLPSRLTQSLSSTRITSTNGNGLTVRAAYASTIKDAVTFGEALQPGALTFGPEAGWMNVLIGKDSGVSHLQWWSFAEQRIIDDIERDAVRYVGVIYQNGEANLALPGYFGLRLLPAYLRANYTPLRAFDNYSHQPPETDCLRIEFYERLRHPPSTSNLPPSTTFTPPAPTHGSDFSP